jgi:type I restriction enzyme S subunit
VARGGVKQSTADAPVEGLWALPEGWHWEPLGNLGKWCGGGTPSKARAEFWTDGTIPWVSPKDMKRALIDSSEDQITVDAVAGSSAKTVRAGSLLCVMRSGILRHTFPVAVNTVDVTLNQDMRALTPRADVEPRYLSYYLRFTGNTVLHTTSKAGTTVNSIEASRLDRHPVPITDMGRQRSIVAAKRRWRGRASIWRRGARPSSGLPSLVN